MQVSGPAGMGFNSILSGLVLFRPALLRAGLLRAYPVKGWSPQGLSCAGLVSSGLVVSVWLQSQHLGQRLRHQMGAVRTTFERKVTVFRRVCKTQNRII